MTWASDGEVTTADQTDVQQLFVQRRKKQPAHVEMKEIKAELSSGGEISFEEWGRGQRETSEGRRDAASLGPNGSQASERTDADAAEGNLNISVSASALLFLISICPSAGVSPHTSLVLLKGSLLFCPWGQTLSE